MGPISTLLCICLIQLTEKYRIIYLYWISVISVNGNKEELHAQGVRVLSARALSAYQQPVSYTHLDVYKRQVRVDMLG